MIEHINAGHACNPYAIPLNRWIDKLNQVSTIETGVGYLQVPSIKLSGCYPTTLHLRHPNSSDLPQDVANVLQNLGLPLQRGNQAITKFMITFASANLQIITNELPIDSRVHHHPSSSTAAARRQMPHLRQLSMKASPQAPAPSAIGGHRCTGTVASLYLGLGWGGCGIQWARKKLSGVIIGS